MHDETDEDEDDDDDLVGLAFVEDTKHEKASFEAFMEREKTDTEEQSIQDLQLSAWSSFESLSEDDEDDDEDDINNNWNKSPVSTDDDGFSYDTRSVRNTSNLFFSLGETHIMLTSYTKELSQATVATASTWMTSDPGYGEI
jgi:hypothetical protein